MKEQLKSIGWMGWTALALAVALFVAVLVSVNTKQSQDEPLTEQNEGIITDASSDDVRNVSDEDREIPVPVTEEVVSGDANEGTVVEDEASDMPTTGAVGQEEFEYHFDWN